MRQDRRWLETMPYDKRFDLVDGTKDQLCHATGYEVFADGYWWNEYEDTDGNLYYGR